MALAAACSLTGLGCGHTLSFDQGRYEVRVLPLTAKAHKYEDMKLADLSVSLDETVVPYEFRGNWAATMGLWPDGDAYANVMSTTFVHVKDHRISADGVDANAVGLALADAMKPFGFRCEAPQSDTAAGLPGVKVECEARRRTSDIQKLRMRELWAADGFLLQAVTWTPGSQAAPEAEKFWASLRVAEPSETRSANEPSLRLAALPVDAVVSHTFGSRN